MFKNLPLYTKKTNYQVYLLIFIIESIIKKVLNCILQFLPNVNNCYSPVVIVV